MPYWEEPRYNDPDKIDSVEDVRLPSLMHHMQVKAELDLLVRAGALEDEQAMQAMKNWRAKQELGNDRKLRAAVNKLEDRNLLDQEQAETIRKELAP